MAGDQEWSASRRYKDLDARVAENEAKIAALEARADEARDRASAGEARAQDDQQRIEALEGRADVDAVLIAELRAEGLVGKAETANLTLALRTSRKIGAAIGILMATHRVSEEAAFQLLRKASMDANQKLRDVADEVVRTGELGGGAK